MIALGTLHRRACQYQDRKRRPTDEQVRYESDNQSVVLEEERGTPKLDGKQELERLITRKQSTKF